MEKVLITPMLNAFRNQTFYLCKLKDVNLNEETFSL